MGQAGSDNSSARGRPRRLPPGKPGASAGRGAAAQMDMAPSRTPSHRSFTIPSDFNDARDVQKAILDDVERAGFHSQNVFAIKLALEEALINAIKHGNQFDPAKTVLIEARITPDQAVIEIEDQGGGFERTCVPDPTLEENLEKCSGRGILLMEAYMNSVQWTRGGRRVRMVKRNDEDVLPQK